MKNINIKKTDLPNITSKVISSKQIDLNTELVFFQNPLKQRNTTTEEYDLYAEEENINTTNKIEETKKSIENKRINFDNEITEYIKYLTDANIIISDYQILKIYSMSPEQLDYFKNLLNKNIPPGQCFKMIDELSKEQLDYIMKLSGRKISIEQSLNMINNLSKEQLDYFINLSNRNTLNEDCLNMINKLQKEELNYFVNLLERKISIEQSLNMINIYSKEQLDYFISLSKRNIPVEQSLKMIRKLSREQLDYFMKLFGKGISIEQSLNMINIYSKEQLDYFIILSNKNISTEKCLNMVNELQKEQLDCFIKLHDQGIYKDQILTIKDGYEDQILTVIKKLSIDELNVLNKLLNQNFIPDENLMDIILTNKNNKWSFLCQISKLDIFLPNDKIRTLLTAKSFEDIYPILSFTFNKYYSQKLGLKFNETDIMYLFSGVPLNTIKTKLINENKFVTSYNDVSDEMLKPAVEINKIITTYLHKKASERVIELISKLAGNNYGFYSTPDICNPNYSEQNKCYIDYTDYNGIYNAWCAAFVNYALINTPIIEGNNESISLYDYIIFDQICNPDKYSEKIEETRGLASATWPLFVQSGNLSFHKAKDANGNINYIPKRGDIVWFDWSGTKICNENQRYANHVGIVDYVEKKINESTQEIEYIIHTIEGNTSNIVAKRNHDIFPIIAFGSWNTSE